MSQTCESCGYYLYHEKDRVDNHETCLCFAICYRGICCIRGFEALIVKKPLWAVLFANYFVPKYHNRDILLCQERNERPAYVYISQCRSKVIKEACEAIVDKSQYQFYLFNHRYINEEEDPYFNDPNYFKETYSIDTID